MQHNNNPKLKLTYSFPTEDATQEALFRSHDWPLEQRLDFLSLDEDQPDRMRHVPMTAAEAYRLSAALQLLRQQKTQRLRLVGGEVA